MSALGYFLGKSVARVIALGNFLEKVYEGRKGQSERAEGAMNQT